MSVAGCGGSSSGTSPPINSGTTLSGTVAGGLNPIAGAAVTLWQAGSGYGTGAIALSTGTSNAKGAFTLRSIKCSASSVETYVTAIGGNAGSGNNQDIGLMTATGPCGDLAQFGSVAINELTTVAGEWSLGQFADVTGQIIGAPSTNATGLQHSVALAGTNLVDPNTGALVPSLASAVPSCSQSPPSPVCGTLEKINTLADILAACIGSTGPSSNGCGNLFANAAGVAPSSTTLGAAHAMATNPASNPQPLYAIIATIAQPPFLPVVTVKPADLLIALDYSGGGLNQPAGIAIDSSGNAWIANTGGASVTELSYLGSATGPLVGGGLDDPKGIAVDSKSNVWVTNPGSDSVTELPTSSRTAPLNFTGGGLNAPGGVAIDTFDIVWVANSGNDSLTALCGATVSKCPSGTTTGAPLSPSTGFVGGGLDAPQDVALDNSGNVWLANCGAACNPSSQSLGSLSRFCGFVGFDLSLCNGVDPGVPLSSDGHKPPGIDGPVALAVDNGFNVFSANLAGNSVSFFPSAASTLGGDGNSFFGAGLMASDAIALDGSGFIWVANQTGGPGAGLGSVSYLAGANPLNPPGALFLGEGLSPSTGFGGAGIKAPAGIAIDSSGDVWVTNSGGTSVTEFIGAAIPVRTPLKGPPLRP